MVQLATGRKLTKILIVFVAIAAAGYAYIHAHTPRRMQVVAAIDGSWPQAASTGFLVQPNVNQTYAFHDWQTGKPQWLVDAPEASGNMQTALSNDGKTLAITNRFPHKIKYRVWHGGKRVVTAAFQVAPTQLQDSYGLYALGPWGDTQQFLYVFAEGKGLTLWLLDGSTIVACGHIVGVPSSVYNISLAMDGCLLKADYALPRRKVRTCCWEINRQRATLQATLRPLRPAPDHKLTLFSGAIFYVGGNLRDDRPAE